MGATAAVSGALTPARAGHLRVARRRRPWLSYVVLIALFAALGPYDIHNRADHEETQEAGPRVLKMVASGEGQNIEEGNIARRLAVLALGAFAAILLVRARQRGQLAPIVPFRERPLSDKIMTAAVVGYLAVAATSVAWAEEPGLAARRVFVFLVLSLTAYALARVWSLGDFMIFVIVACGAMLMGSLALDIVHHDFHPLAGDYRLAGLTHPNSHAIEAAALVIAAVWARRLEPDRRKLYAAIVLVGVGLILLTRSRTALVGLVIGLVAVPVLMLRTRSAVMAAMAGVAALIVVGVFLPEIVQSAQHALLMGRSQETADVGTLTGRTDLWKALLLYIAKRPLLGYGFDAFWTADHVEAVTLDQGWLISHAHNSYIENALNLGWVGMGAFVVSVFTGIWVAGRRVLASRAEPQVAFALTALVWLAASMMTEAIMPLTHYGSLIGMTVLAWLFITGGARRAV